MAIQAGFQCIIVEGGNKTVIQAVQGSNKVSWRIHYILKDIQYWKAAGIQISFIHAFRQVNRAVDWIAKFGHIITHPILLDKCFSPGLHAIIVDDVVGCSFVRKGA